VKQILVVKMIYGTVNTVYDSGVHSFIRLGDRDWQGTSGALGHRKLFYSIMKIVLSF